MNGARNERAGKHTNTYRFKPIADKFYSKSSCMASKGRKKTRRNIMLMIEKRIRMREEERVGTTKVRRRHSLPGSLSSHSRLLRSGATRRDVPWRYDPLLLTRRTQCAARALRNRVSILRLLPKQGKQYRIAIANLSEKWKISDREISSIKTMK